MVDAKTEAVFVKEYIDVASELCASENYSGVVAVLSKAKVHANALFSALNGESKPTKAEPAPIPKKKEPLLK
jgi:hypothetical protein